MTDRRAVVDYLASLDDHEYRALSHEARNISRSTNIRESVDAKSAQLVQLIARTTSNGHLRPEPEQEDQQ